MPAFMDTLNGKKTYILAFLGIAVGIAGHYWGPIHIGDVTIPQFSWNQVLAIVWNSGLFATLRHGVANTAQ